MRLHTKKYAFHEAFNNRLIQLEEDIVKRAKHLLTFQSQNSGTPFLKYEKACVKVEVLYYIIGLSYPVHQLDEKITYQKAILKNNYGWFCAGSKYRHSRYSSPSFLKSYPQFNQQRCFLFDELIREGVAFEDISKIERVWVTLTYEEKVSVVLSSIRGDSL